MAFSTRRVAVLALLAGCLYDVAGDASMAMHSQPAFPSSAGFQGKVASQAASQAMSAALAPEIPLGSQMPSPGSQPGVTPINLPSVPDIPTPSASTPHASPSSATSMGGANENLGMHKPKVVEAFVPHMFQFVTNPPGETCEDLSQELSKNEATAQAHVQFEVILGSLDPNMFDTPQERVNADKNAASSLHALSTEMVKEGGDGSSGDLVNYMDRILRCKVQPVAEGKGILQKILEMGMEKSLKTPFAENLIRGSADYDPALILDAEGNNLMHLAVKSGGYNVPTTLFTLEDKKNMADPSRKMNGIYWLLSALMHRNAAGQRPLDIKVDSNMSTKLKRYFRSYTLYLKMQAKKFGITQSEVRAVEDLLKTSKNAPPVQQSVSPHF